MNDNGQHSIDKQSILEHERLYQRLLSAQSQEDCNDSLSELEDNEIPYEQMEAVWTARALQLARPLVEEQQGEQMEVLLVRLGREVLGIEVRYVVEIRQDEPITRVPRVPAWVVGVTNLRGHILSVIDLRAFLGLPADPTHSDKSGDGTHVADFLVEVESPEMELVLRVNDVLGVEAVPASHIHAENGLIHTLPPEYLRGVVEQENGRWLMADDNRKSSEKGAGRSRKNGKKNSDNRGADEKQVDERRANSMTVSILNLNALLTDPRLLINDYAGDDDRS